MTIKSLKISDLALVKETVIRFRDGLSVISGETGAGKTALIDALQLILGKRSDPTKVRKGAEKARIEATFEPERPALLAPLFEEAGIPFDPDEELVLVREIKANGKSRAFAASSSVSSTFLSKLAPHLVEFIGQSSQSELRREDNQLQALDQFTKIDLAPFQNLLREEQTLENERAKLEKLATEGQQKKPLIEEGLKELDDLELKEGEETELFEEYTLLANSQELLASAEALLESTDGLLDQSMKLAPQIQVIAKYEERFSEAQALANEAQLPLQELRALTLSFLGKLEGDPRRLTLLEERLTRIERLKKKYGKDLAQARITLQDQLEEIEGAEEKIKSLDNQLVTAKEATDLAAQVLTRARQIGADTLARNLTDALRHLNIPSAEVQIHLSPTLRKRTGDDQVCFYLKANQGEKPAAVKDAVSGGELARLFFALKVAIGSDCPTLIFDEIDANVGGKTATAMGNQLKLLGEKHQVFCITHFPQVARFGKHHLKVEKVEEEGRTHCQMRELTEKERHDELLRMVGGEEVTNKGALLSPS